jgi:molybdopterin converting factor subunit 1
MIKVLLFASLQDLAQKHEINLEEKSISLGDLKEKLREEYQDLSNSMERVMVAVNEEYVDDNNITLKSGDVVALIPPVSGG